MRIRHWFVRPALLLAVLALLAAACGDDGDSSGSAPDEDPSPTTDADPVDDGDTDEPDTSSNDAEDPAPEDTDPDDTASDEGPYAGYVSATYDDPAVWLCWPGNDDVCARNHDITLIRADGTLEVEPFVPAADAAIDCFYVYPTISADRTPNSDLVPGELEETYTTWAQAARYGEVCDVYAPMYPQNTLPSMMGQIERPEGLDTREVAYAGVLDAWSHYMATANDGRGVLLMGHSQGAGTISRLIAEEIDDDPVLRGRFVGAHILGTSVAAAVSEAFSSITACTEVGELGCVVSFASYEERTPLTDGDFFGISDGEPALCTNPASLDGSRAVAQTEFLLSDPPGLLGNSIVPPLPEDALAAVTTDWVGLPDMVTVECIDNGRQGYLSVGIDQAEGDVRADDIGGRFAPGWGLHVIDANVVLGDLVDLAAAQAAAYAG